MRPWTRRLLVAAAILTALGAGAVLGGIVYFPELGAWAVRSRVLPRVEATLGRELSVATVDVTRGRVVLGDVLVHGPNDADDAPLAQVEKITVDFDLSALLRGRIVLGEAAVEGADVHLVRHPDGRDNVRDLLARLRPRPGAETATAPSGPGAGSLRPSAFTLARGSLTLVDHAAGASVAAGHIDASVGPAGDVDARLGQVIATSELGPRATAAAVVITTDLATPIDSALVRIEDAAAELRDGISLSGIAGTIESAGSTTLDVDLAGSYGGARERLWTARGRIDPARGTAALDLEAERFTFDRLDEILRDSMVVDYDQTALSASVHLAVDDGAGLVRFEGELELEGLSVFHPMLATKPVRDLGARGRIEGRFEREARTLTVAQAVLQARGVDFELSGSVALPGGLEPGAPGEPTDADTEDTAAETDTEARPEPAATATPAVERAAMPSIARSADPAPDPRAPDPATPAAVAAEAPAMHRRVEPRVEARLVVPPVPCQTVFDALPEALVPYLEGFELDGRFHTDVRVAIDWADLQATELDGSVGIFDCTAREPDVDDAIVTRLSDSFTHYVEVEREQWIAFVIGFENPDFVPLWDISPYVPGAFMTTEDSRFYDHEGFIPREFRSALIKNLEAGYFRFGASSITMQTVKNVLLYREKTLARKLQELFLTWYLETQLDKDRILEIYVNAIEYGPGLYGIGPAARHFFGKHPRELNPVEAAYLASILPSPKLRYKQYCADKLWRSTENKLRRVLGLMHERERLTDAEYEIARVTPLVFDRTEAEPETQCKRLVRRAIKNARPTNPLAK
ncbi:transglycosylase domain-containing protein [Haliangium sp.]|uniref:AsmA family protein n=1 Tax=Haliangium sp. TaxID=2663208 RepID=UPI003D097B23